MPVNMVIILINFSYSLDSPQTICIGAHNPYNDVKSSLYIVYKKAEIGMKRKNCGFLFCIYCAFYVNYQWFEIKDDIKFVSHYHGWDTLYKRLQTNQKH